MDPNGRAALTLRIKILEIELKAAQMRADGYRDILLSVIDEGVADASTSMRSASQLCQLRVVPSFSSRARCARRSRCSGTRLAPAPSWSPSFAPAPGPASSHPVATSQPIDRGPTGIDDEENLPHEGAVIDIVHDTEEWTLEAGDETDSADEKDNVDKVLAE